MDELSYECVVCTRNRPDALRQSIPRLVAQTRAPARILVVDSSDDHEQIRAVVQEAGAGAPCAVTVLASPRGLTAQRNAGLRLVTADVVFFPDDDALCDPDYAEQILAIYERDAGARIGAVIGTHRSSPRGEEAAALTREMSPGARLRQRINVPRTRIERRLVRDPLAVIGWQYKATWDIPDWLAELDAHPNCWVRGFRMTFRTNAIREVGGFDEALRNYANFEDIHAGLAVGERHVVVQADRARVFHLQAPGGRGSGRVRGATNIANRAYVVARHSAPGSLPRRLAVRYGAYRCLLYGLGSVLSAYNRDCLRGALAALVRIRPLLMAPPERAAAAYETLLRRAGVSFD